MNPCPTYRSHTNTILSEPRSSMYIRIYPYINLLYCPKLYI